MPKMCSSRNEIKVAPPIRKIFDSFGPFRKVLDLPIKTLKMLQGYPAIWKGDDRLESCPLWSSSLCAPPFYQWSRDTTVLCIAGGSWDALPTISVKWFSLKNQTSDSQFSSGAEGSDRFAKSISIWKFVPHSYRRHENEEVV